jgi:hypothetical protein
MQQEVYRDEQCYEAGEVENQVRCELVIMAKAELQLSRLQTNCDHNDTITRWNHITARTVQLLFRS